MPVNVKLLGKTMVAAAHEIGFGARDWMRTNPGAEIEIRLLASAAGDIEALLRQGTISESRARDMFAMRQVAFRQMMRWNGSGPELADKLLGAALSSIRGPIGRVLLDGTTAAFKAGKDL